MQYGLIGNPLKHSFSKEIHKKLANYEYELCELSDSSFDDFMREKNFKAINVTIPYKQRVIPYLDFIDENAKNINAVNTIVNDNGKLKGYNTDILGVLDTFSHFGIDVKNKNVLILGTGATSNTVYHAVASASQQTVGASTASPNRIYKAYRENSKIKGDILYSDIPKLYDEINITINTTSNGMYPHEDDELLVDLSKFKNLEAVMDVVYNPLRTRLLQEAEKLNIKAVSGLYMLVSQAYFASELFTNNNNINEPDPVGATHCEPANRRGEHCEPAYKECLTEKQNIVLTGMPTCGKTTIAKLISEKYGYDYIDTDDLIEQKINCKIVDFIKKNGEEKFRDIETEIIKEIRTKNHVVIATGGGAILRTANITNLKYNGKIFFINRSLENLKPTIDRPLTSDIESLTKKYKERLPIYKSTCDVEIDGDIEINDRVKLIIAS